MDSGCTNSPDFTTIYYNLMCNIKARVEIYCNIRSHTAPSKAITSNPIVTINVETVYFLLGLVTKTLRVTEGSWVGLPDCVATNMAGKCPDASKKYPVLAHL